MRYTLRQIQYFIATAETGSITLAAERVHISQPSISAAITSLEDVLKVQLFVRRHAQGLTLTPIGKDLLVQAKLLLEQAENLYIIASESATSTHGQLTLGCMITLASMIMPELTYSFQSCHNQATINNVVDDHDALLLKLRNAEIDIALSYDLLIPEGFDFCELAELPPYVVVGENHYLSSKQSLWLKNIVKEPLLLLDLPISKEYFLALYFNQNLNPNIGMRSPHLEVLRTAAANGYGYTLANVRPRSHIAMDGRKLKYIPLEDKLKPMVIGLITLKSTKKTRLVELFFDHCRKIISNELIPGMDSPYLKNK